MKVILFGASGMVGQGVLRECLRSAEVTKVLAVVRAPLEQKDPKLEELIQSDLADLAPVESKLSGYDACFFCLGVSSAGMSEEKYRKLTHDLTLSAASILSRLNPQMTFIYVSGSGTDSSEKGGSMWARVKGQTENALLKLPFKAVYLFRPGFIQPMHGIKSKTGLYRAIYNVVGPIYPLLNKVAPRFLTTTEEVGLAMLRVAKQGAPKRFLENTDIRALATS
jgi:uncharacterized protein YbjT (DUF2867 family)